MDKIEIIQFDMGMSVYFNGDFVFKHNWRSAEAVDKWLDLLVERKLCEVKVYLEETDDVPDYLDVTQ